MKDQFYIDQDLREKLSELNIEDCMFHPKLQIRTDTTELLNAPMYKVKRTHSLGCLQYSNNELPLAMQNIVKYWTSETKSHGQIIDNKKRKLLKMGYSTEKIEKLIHPFVKKFMELPKVHETK